MGQDDLFYGAGEGHLAGHGPVEDDPGGIEITGHRHRLSPGLLGAQVGHGTGQRLPLGHLVDAYGKIEIEKPRVAVGVDDDVLGLDIAVDDATAMQVSERLQHAYEGRDEGGPIGVLLKPAAQPQARRQRHDYAGIAAHLDLTLDRVEIRVVEPIAVAEFAPRPPVVLHGKQFDRLYQTTVAGQKDLGHGARGDRPNHLEVVSKTATDYIHTLAF